MVCLACESRPRKNGSIFCHVCGEYVINHKTTDWWRKAHKIISWRGFGVALMPKKGDIGNLKPRRMTEGELKRVPMKLKIDLNIYHGEFNRDQIKAMKRTVRQVYPEFV